jgi:GntR family transcriptional regulator, transcriptional repressor for pyruvate dehydrogenase complex
MNGQMRQPRVAELLASRLRSDILSGRIQEGDSLPRQENLLADFGVSLPSVREAMRILETEGLISVRRGNIGGAVVHLPTAQRTAYMISLVLQARRTTLLDVGQALRQLEPACAGMCASRDDRMDTIVPLLATIVDDQKAKLDDVGAFNLLARRFHEGLVAHCGNETMLTVIGSLESIWSAHEVETYQHIPAPRPHDEAVAVAQGLRSHRALVAAIASGAVDRATSLARIHLEATQAYTLSRGKTRQEIQAEIVRVDRL